MLKFIPVVLKKFIVIFFSPNIVTVDCDDRWFDWLLDIFKIYKISPNKHLNRLWFEKFIAFLLWCAILPLFKLFLITASKLDLKPGNVERCIITDQVNFIKVFNAESVLNLYQFQY